MRHKIIIKEPTETVNDVGEPITAWSIFAVRSAKITPRGGNESFRFEQYDSNATIAFQLRYDGLTANINTKMKVNYDSRTFDIISIVNTDEMNREIILVADEET